MGGCAIGVIYLAIPVPAHIMLPVHVHGVFKTVGPSLTVTATIYLGCSGVVWVISGHFSPFLATLGHLSGKCVANVLSGAPKTASKGVFGYPMYVCLDCAVQFCAMLGLFLVL